MLICKGICEVGLRYNWYTIQRKNVYNFHYQEQQYNQIHKILGAAEAKRVDNTVKTIIWFYLVVVQISNMKRSTLCYNQ